MRKFFFIAILSSFVVSVCAQPKRMTAQEYIARFKHIAMEEMLRTGIPASIKLAQGLLESEMGNSDLVKRSNNHFGIKCKSNWTGESVSHDDDARGECFRKYDNADDSYRDHSEFLMTRKHYEPLFKLKSDDYKGWAYGLKRAGYATNPRYPQMLIYNIEKYNLQLFDEMVLAGDFKSETETQTPPVQIVEELNEPVETVEPVQPAIKPQTRAAASAAADYRNKTKRNGLQAVFAPAGTSLLAVATTHRIALARLLEFNDITRDGILEEDMWLYLEKKNKEAETPSHTAREGETLMEISQRYGVQLSRLVDYNNLSPIEKLSAGKVVNLKPVALEDMSSPARRTRTVIHEVGPKEGLYAISRKYNVSVENLRKWNNLTTDSLHVGQQLIISK